MGKKCPRCNKAHSSGEGVHQPFTRVEHLALLRAGHKAVLSWPPHHGRYIQVEIDGKLVGHPAYQAWAEVFGEPIDAGEAATFFSEVFVAVNLDWPAVLDSSPLSVADILFGLIELEDLCLE